MAEPCHSAEFEKAINVTPIDSHTYSAYLDPQWCILSGKFNLPRHIDATVYFRETKCNQFRSTPEPIGMQLSFLRRTVVGPAVLRVQDIKIGARISTIHVTLSQRPDRPGTASDKDDLEVKVVGYITVSPPDMEEGPIRKGTWGLSPPPVSGSLAIGSVNLEALAANGTDGAWMRLPRPPPAVTAPQHLEIYTPRPQGPMTLESRQKQVVDQWARFIPGGKKVARWSNEAVMFLADMFPAALDRMGAMETSRLLAMEGVQEGELQGNAHDKGAFWYPTVTLNIDLKTRIPPEGVEWLQSRVVTRMLRGSRADLDVVILDPQGELIALSTQVALVVNASRNTKGRAKSEKL
ncbi:thioesterase family protein [Aspergillus fischeri NRRL 181]|uniref:Thioesterase family protein n=1 Tax=Neosartorya fischeri (strain ATCC 1020 / DSM 3700 / CBS 544.65 / FGSC A1164 / JCM 1740 / NRRL 181 / WB 181) TaxID=331117 RepID=A1D2C0_NEOFI|nr:conserved hypothetical protein [Aspergillus fischeri NRRL 181]EAW22563.1 conserved hypothetical protein [Aspergillus fischeri NRRL 181]